MSFNLVISSHDDSPSSKFLEYVAKNEPVITRRDDGRIDVGLISFETLETQIIPFKCLRSIADHIEQLVTSNGEYVLGILFEQTTGNPVLVIVEEKEIDGLTELLDAGFPDFPKIELMD